MRHDTGRPMQSVATRITATLKEVECDEDVHRDALRHDAGETTPGFPTPIVRPTTKDPE